MTALLNKIASLISPLSEFYRSDDDVLRDIDVVEPDDMPQPYRDLLVHHNDMTPTLESHWGRAIRLHPLSRMVDDGVLFREVVLVAESIECPVEFGAICIHLTRFTEAPRRLIIDSQNPLGSILREHKIEHTSEPTGYFRITSESIARKAFGIETDVAMFGRHNVLRDMMRRTLAEVVEILPPMESMAHA